MGMEEKMTRFALHKLGTLTALLSFAALLAVPQAFAADVTPPTLESFNLLTSEINVTDGPGSVVVELRITDDESGPTTTPLYAYSNTAPQGYWYTEQSILSSSNDGLSILFRVEIVLRQGAAPGPWRVEVGYLIDKQGNLGPRPDLTEYDTTFTVVEDAPDQSSTDASGSSSDSDEDDPCSGTGYNPNCSDSSGSASDSDEDDPCSGTGYNPNCSDSSSDSTSSDSGGTSSGSTSDSDSGSTSSSSSSDGSSDGAGGTACDPEVDFGCTTSGDDSSGDTSGTVSSLGVTLEEPAVGLVHMGVGNLRGWAVSSAGIRKVEAFLDGEFLGEIPYGGARTDVGLAFPDIDGSDQSGFGMSFNYSGLSAGTHTIEVVAHSIDNKTASDSAQFETVRFDREFIGAGETINLNAAASVLTNDQIRVENILIAGKYYNLLLRWRTAEQGFEIVEIEALD